MISWWDPLLVAVFVVTGVGLITRAVGGLRAAWLVLRLPAQPIGSVREGRVKVAGTVHPLERVLVSPTGQRCVAMRTVVERWVHQGRHARWELVRDTFESVPAEVRDGTGACVLDLQRAEILGETCYLGTGGPDPGASDRTTVQLVPEGSRVLVVGQAAPVGNAAGQGYRDAAARVGVGATPEQDLLLSTSGDAGTLWRSAWPALVAVACALVVLGCAATLTVLSRELASLVR